MMIRAIVLSGAVGVLLGMPTAHAGTSNPDLDAAIQVIADLTAIDADCRDLSVNFGIGLQYAAGQGLAASAIMPAGPERSAFEMALQLARSDYGDAIECGVLAHHYSVALPGSVTFAPVRARS